MLLNVKEKEDDKAEPGIFTGIRKNRKRPPACVLEQAGGKGAALKRMIRVFGKILISLSICLVVAVSTIFGLKGYKMYQKAIKEVPLTEKIESIQAMEGFITYDELPEIYIDAVISAEDQRFWEHHGIDLLAIGRALWNDLRTLSFAEGGSTITQQLAKNEYFTQEKKLERKFAEVFLALDLEKQYNKREIFECYVNTIYFGSGYYGISAAAEGYYGKTPSELSDYEAVMLAGLPNAPSVYSPDSNPELAKQRMRQVLKRMEECGKITKEEAEQLQQEEK